MPVTVVTWLVVVVGVVVLVGVLLMALGHVRRFAAARGVATRDIATATAELRAIAAARPHRAP